MKVQLTTLAVVAVFIALAILGVIHSTKKQVVTVIPIVQHKGTPKELVDRWAKVHNVSPKLISELITLENQPKWDPELQSKCKYKENHPEWGVKKGDRELSYGLAMIHIPSHPKITMEMAKNPDFAIEFMSKEVASGRGNQWTCFRKAKYNVQHGISGGKCT